MTQSTKTYATLEIVRLKKKIFRLLGQKENMFNKRKKTELYKNFYRQYFMSEENWLTMMPHQGKKYKPRILEIQQMKP